MSVLEQCKCVEAALTLRGADVRFDRRAGQAQPERFATFVRVDHPAAQLGEPRFGAERRQAVPVEHVRHHVGSSVLLGVQSLSARVRLPRHAAQRVAGLERSQPGKVVVALGVFLGAARVGRHAGWRAAALRGCGPGDGLVVAVHAPTTHGTTRAGTGSRPRNVRGARVRAAARTASARPVPSRSAARRRCTPGRARCRPRAAAGARTPCSAAASGTSPRCRQRRTRFRRVAAPARRACRGSGA